MATDDAVLRILQCSKCDYDLRDLPAEHACPECGFKYDLTMFTIRASLHQRWRPRNPRAWRIVLYGSAAVIVGIVAWIGKRYGIPWQRAIGIAAIPSLGIAAASWIMTRAHVDRSQLSAAWFVDRNGMVLRRRGESRLRFKWRRVRAVAIEREDDRWWISLRCRGVPDWLQPPFRAAIEASDEQVEVLRARLPLLIAEARERAREGGSH